MTAFRPRAGLASDSSRPAGPQQHTIDPLDEIVSLVTGKQGFDLARFSRTSVQRHVVDRMRQRSIRSTSDYLALLRRNPSEIRSLRTALLASGTVFFRDPGVWDFVARDVIPRLMAHARSFRPLRVWVPHCGAGAEAYTLAMLLLEHSSKQEWPVTVQLFASDDDDALAVGRAGKISRIAGTGIGPSRLERFFAETPDGYQVRHDLRRAVTFARHDLLSDLPFLHMDLICCRYLLVHLRPPARAAVVSLLQRSLNDGGYLVLGTAEHLGRVPDHLEVVSRRWSVFRRSNGAPPPPSVSTPRPENGRATGGAPARTLHEAPPWSAPVKETDHRKLAGMLRLMSMGKLAASLAHELSQPLSAVANILEACAIHLRTGGASPEELLDLTHQASSQSHRARRIVAHITRLLHEGERQVERCELRTLVRTAAELVRPTLLRQGIELQLVLGEVPLWGNLCRVEIEQVVVNLLQNAIDAIIEGGGDRRRIGVEVSEASTERATVTVSDTGRGIAAEVAERLFEAFFTTKPDGFGMGMAICRAIIDAHGGRLWIDRTSGGEAKRICFSLPLVRRGPTAASAHDS